MEVLNEIGLSSKIREKAENISKFQNFRYMRRLLDKSSDN